MKPRTFMPDQYSAQPTAQSSSPSPVLPDGFTLHQVRDTQHQNVVAGIFAHPENWRAGSEIVWNFQDMSLPVKGRAYTCNSQGAECVEFLPGEMFGWMAEGQGFYKSGQNVLGLAFVPPMSCADALQKWVIPKFRSGLPGLRVLGAGKASILPRLGLQAQGLQGEEACVALEYSLNGIALEEEIYGVKVQQNIPYHGPQGTMVQINWGFTRLFSFRAERGQMAAKRELFWQIAASMQLNPLWEQLLGRIMQQLEMQFNAYIQQGYSQIQAAGQLSQAISANNDVMLAGFAQQRENARRADLAHRHAEAAASGRTTHDEFSDMMRGVDTVQDPYWGESQQDANYLYHWTDGHGNYQHSDDPFFDPSLGSTINWTLMTPVQR